MSEVEHKH